MANLDELRRALGEHFALERVLGQGGMGAVYLARDRRLDRLVALKVLPAEFATQAALRERFLRETRTAASFSHPNIVPVFSIEEHGELLAYAMGYVEGETLAELVARTGPLSVREVVRVLQDVGYALAYAHGRDVVHRDIKPDNIMIERATGRALLMDFGISRTVQTGAVSADAAGPGHTSLTRVGEVVGTPEFMSPEQAAGDHVDGRSDLYSLGLVAWFALTGNSAMRGESTQKVLVKQLTEAVPPVRSLRADVPPLLEEVIARCVAKSPDERFANAEALVDALDTSALRGVEIPLPVRLVAQDLSQAGLVLTFGAVFLPIFYTALTKMYGDADLDLILPLVLVSAILWARTAQSIRYLRSVAVRGFNVDALQTGFAALIDERRAEREQLKANPAIVAARRRQIFVFSGLLIGTYFLRQYALDHLRVEYEPGMFAVKRTGVIIFYSVAVIRGIAVVGLLRSPLRANIGEKFFGLLTSTAGRWLLSLVTMGIRSGDSSATIPSTRAITSPSASGPLTPVSRALTATPAQASATLEQRVAALEAWRDQQSSLDTRSR